MTNRDPQTYAIIGAGMEVHKQLGAGFLEAVYHEALAIEMTAQKIPYWTLAFFTFSSVERFAKSLYVPERKSKFARLQFLISTRLIYPTI